MAVGTVARAGRVLLVLWFLLPLVPILLWSVANQWRFPALSPQEWGLTGLRSALSAGAVDAFATSAVLGVSVAGLATPAGALAARALVLHRVHFRGAAAVVLVAPLAFPPFAVAMGLDVLILRAGIPNLIGAVLILTVVAIPYTTYIMRVGFGAYDIRFEEEARTLGASGWVVFWRVQLPLLAPAIATAGFLAFLVGWTDYIVTLLVGGGRLVSVPVLVGAFAAGSGNQPVVAALSVAAIAPPLVLLLLLWRLRGRRAP
ncbi:ABC transporter permease [Hoyosella altamirensis]|uniref:Putative spermidine/putrescine transport system permease protein n=1 Tax=Hoyosella altamirensis TaxID=616997 RepID=A0A839RTY1_9ACTN|nr:ABC transporter permease subunit [Hoyosella altamirensis]MBB3039524.1 putative spermidine/putrescine transport system permease protein [Hoyosella altamirensis]